MEICILVLQKKKDKKKKTKLAWTSKSQECIFGVEIEQLPLKPFKKKKKKK